LASRRHRHATALSWGYPVLRGLMSDPVVFFWTSNTGLRDVMLARAVSLITVPEPSDSGVFRLGPGPPSEFLTTSRPSDPSVGSDSPEVSAPYDDVTRTSPLLERGRPPSLPVPPAGFHNLPAVSQQARVCGLVSCRCRPWATSPFRAFPRKDRCTSLEAACSPAVIPAHPACAVRDLSPRVSPTPAPSLARLPVSPRGYGLPFDRPPMAGRSPGRPGPRTANSRPTARFIRFEALIPLRSPRRRPHEFPRGSGRALLGSRPSRAFSTRPSEPPTRHSLGPRHLTRVNAPARPRGPRSPHVGWTRSTDHE